MKCSPGKLAMACIAACIALILDVPPSGAQERPAGFPACQLLDPADLDNVFEAPVIKSHYDGKSNSCQINLGDPGMTMLSVSISEAQVLIPGLLRGPGSSAPDIPGPWRMAAWNGSTFGVWSDTAQWVSAVVMAPDSRLTARVRKGFEDAMAKGVVRMDSILAGEARAKFDAERQKLSSGPGRTACVTLRAEDIEGALHLRVSGVTQPKDAALDLCNYTLSDRSIYSFSVGVMRGIEPTLWDVMKTTPMPGDDGVTPRIEDIAGLGKSAYWTLSPTTARIDVLSARGTDLSLSVSTGAELGAASRGAMENLARAALAALH